MEGFNTKTRLVLKDSEKDLKVEYFESAEALFKDLGMSDDKNKRLKELEAIILTVDGQGKVEKRRALEEYVRLRGVPTQNDKPDRFLYYADREHIDEIVTHRWAHLEQMDDDSYYLGIELPNGSLAQVSIASDSPIAVTCYSHTADELAEHLLVESLEP